MVDPEVVRRRLRQIDQRVAALRRLPSDERAFIVDFDLQAQVERHLQIAIQAAIDIAVHVLAENTGTVPEDYGSAFLLLARAGIIPEPLGSRLRRAAGLRNILVHAYLEIDPRRILRHLDDLDDLIAFARAIEEYLERDPGDVPASGGS